MDGTGPYIRKKRDDGRLKKMTVQETLQGLLEKNRNHEKSTGPGINNHVPMVLIALYRMGGSSAQMTRYVEKFNLGKATPPLADASEILITRDNWKSRLGQSAFSSYVDFFDEWISKANMDVVLHSALPVLMSGVCTAAYHALLRLAYGLDYGSRDEVVFALAYWAVEFYPGPDFDADASPVKPEALFDEIIKAASKLHIEPVHSIDGRLQQVYQLRRITHLWKPIHISGSDPLEEMSGLILRIFENSQHFTLLHALTSCQAMRRVLPYLKEPENNLSAYWHSVCAAYVTVLRSSFEMGRDTIPSCEMQWKEIFAKAVASEHSMEHIVKLCYASWQEFGTYNRAEYLALACREIRKPSPFL
jgi:hypothetical protein